MKLIKKLAVLVLVALVLTLSSFGQQTHTAATLEDPNVFQEQNTFDVPVVM